MSSVTMDLWPSVQYPAQISSDSASNPVTKGMAPHNDHITIASVCTSSQAEVRIYRWVTNWCLLAACILLSSGAVEAMQQEVPQTQTDCFPSCNQYCVVFCSKCQMISGYVVLMGTWLPVALLLWCCGDQSGSYSVIYCLVMMDTQGHWVAFLNNT